MTSTADPTDWKKWNDGIILANQAVIHEFRTNAGTVDGYFAGAPMLLLHHRGVRTGQERVTPLVYVPDGDAMVIAATKGGAPHNPDWYHNLTAHPTTTIEVGAQTVVVKAEEIHGLERDRYYAQLARMRPAFAGYEARTERVIPMFRLTRVDAHR